LNWRSIVCAWANTDVGNATEKQINGNDGHFIRISEIINMTSNFCH
jgi:hypothetical protein